MLHTRCSWHASTCEQLIRLVRHARFPKELDNTLELNACYWSRIALLLPVPIPGPQRLSIYFFCSCCFHCACFCSRLLHAAFDTFIFCYLAAVESHCPLSAVSTEADVGERIGHTERQTAVDGETAAGKLEERSTDSSQVDGNLHRLWNAVCHGLHVSIIH